MNEFFDNKRGLSPLNNRLLTLLLATVVAVVVLTVVAVIFMTIGMSYFHGMRPYHSLGTFVPFT